MCRHEENALLISVASQCLPANSISPTPADGQVGHRQKEVARRIPIHLLADNVLPQFCRVA